MTFFETHRHIEHIAFDVFSLKNYVSYVSMCLKIKSYVLKKLSEIIFRKNTEGSYSADKFELSVNFAPQR